MGGDWRRWGWSAVLSAVTAVALLGTGTLMGGPVPAWAAEPSQSIRIRFDDTDGTYTEWLGTVARTGDTVTISGTWSGNSGAYATMKTGAWEATRLWADAGVEGGSVIDGFYTGTMTVEAIVTPPELLELGMTLTTGDVTAFDLELVTDPEGGGEAVFTWYLQGEVIATVSYPMFWEGTVGASTTSSTTTTAPSQLATEDGNTEGGSQAADWSPPSGDDGLFPPGGWSPAGVALAILVVVLVLVALGMGVKEAVADVLSGGIRRIPRREPSVREWAPSVRELGRYIVGSEGTPVTVSGPVEPWSGPDMSTPRAGFVLQPGDRYTVVASTGPGPDHWVLVRSESDGLEGWAHRSALAPWQRDIPMSPTSAPTPTAAWERVKFTDGLWTYTRGSGGGPTYSQQKPGLYRLGPPDAGGHRQITDEFGRLLGMFDPSFPTLPPTPAPPPPPPPASP